MLRAFTQPSNFYQSKNIRWVLRMVSYILAILNFWSMVHSSANKHLHALKKHIWPTSGTLPVSLGCYMDLLSTSIHCICTTVRHLLRTSVCTTVGCHYNENGNLPWTHHQMATRFNFKFSSVWFSNSWKNAGSSSPRPRCFQQVESDFLNNLKMSSKNWDSR